MSSTFLLRMVTLFVVAVLVSKSKEIAKFICLQVGKASTDSNTESSNNAALNTYQHKQKKRLMSDRGLTAKWSPDRLSEICVHANVHSHTTRPVHKSRNIASLGV